VNEIRELAEGLIEELVEESVKKIFKILKYRSEMVCQSSARNYYKKLILGLYLNIEQDRERIEKDIIIK
jgi:hypothetical protein